MTYDLTGIATTVIAGAFSVLSVAVPMILQARMRNKQDAAVLGNAVANSLGAIQRAASGVIVTQHPPLEIPGVPAGIIPGVQYVLEHAGPEAQRLSVGAAQIADKVNAAIGLANIATNLAIAASPSPAEPAPLLPLPAPLSATGLAPAAT